jgi:hypothetical protein
VQGQAGPSWKDSAGVDSYFDSSTVFGPCPERDKVILVTMAVPLLPYRARGCIAETGKFAEAEAVTREALAMGETGDIQLFFGL